MAETQLDLRAADNTGTYIEQPKGEIRVSVRKLVEFLLRHGDIDNRRGVAPDNAMQEGSRIHRMIQRRMGSEYQAEVPLRYTLDTEDYALVVEGRADGIIDKGDEIVIDEIKGTYRELARMKGPVEVHLAQAKCYAYIYGLQRACEEIRVRMTYCNIETEELRYFYEDYSFEALRQWFEALIEDYRKWADFSWQWRQTCRRSIEALEFPYPYRDGQKELMTYVYQTIYHRRKLFLEAPTGVGKTLATIFPTLKAMGRNMGEKFFYLTAKTITGTVAEDTLNLLRRRGLRLKSVVLTARDKICFLEKADCNPDSCPYAKGHYDRINDAMYELLTSVDSFSREKISECAARHRVCPFELGLDMSLFADGVIGDYNYLFDPHVSLRRFFADAAQEEYLFLIDEAHNLLERGRKMYSAELWKDDFLHLRREINKTIASEKGKSSLKSAIDGQMTLEMTGDMTDKTALMSEPDMQMTDRYISERKQQAGRSIFVNQGYASRIEYLLGQCSEKLLELQRECNNYQILPGIDTVVKPLIRLHSAMDDYLDEQEKVKLEIREELLDFFFRIGHFLDIYDRLDEHYVIYSQLDEEERFLVKLFNVNPCENLKEYMGKGRSSILFSATFLPIQYYKGLLGGDEKDYEVYAQSVFDMQKRGLFIAEDVTSKYTRRSDEEYYRIAKYISEIVKVKAGNYMVFCPSFSFLQMIYEVYLQFFCAEGEECILQKEGMREADREEFLARFVGNEDCDLQAVIAMDIDLEKDDTLIGFCVLGGIFGEGIDLQRDRLIGAIIVGTGLPQVCNEREILHHYFNERGENGFDFAYRIPGMNKVLQAGGRVIRTAEDVGIVALLDERFLQGPYRRLFPREWGNYKVSDVSKISEIIGDFWKRQEE